MPEFDKLHFKKLVKQKFGTFENYVTALHHEYGLEKKINTVQKWGQPNNPNTPTAKELPIVAESLKIMVIDLYDNAEEAKKEIVKEALKSGIEHASVPPSDTIRKIAVYGTHAEDEMPKELLIDSNIIKEPYRNMEIEALFVVGDSMVPYAKEGDIILYYRLNCDDFTKDDGKYIIETTYGLQVKNLKFLVAGGVRIISEKSIYHTSNGYDEELDEHYSSKIKIIGKAIGAIIKIS